jgi:energy-coupling factor transporter ATP-binding protein EcfA2
MQENERVTYIGKCDARGSLRPFGIKAKDRTRHVYVIGKTGMGKSTLLENMAVQDIKNGEGLAFIDPHGKSADLLLDYIPPERKDDVLYFAPFDMGHPIAFNVMEDVGYDKRHLVMSGLMSAFKKIWADQWSSRMEYILSNTLLALLEYPDSTILGVNKMYTDKTFRKRVIENIQDPLVKSFWVDEFATYTDRYTQEATPAIQNKIGQFTSNPLVRNIVGQAKSTFDLRKIMDEKKILIVNLSKGQVGEGNANLLGSMMITKIYLAAMSRADVSEAELNTLPNFYTYVDEFQSFANESFADILSEARKYKLNLTMAHQYIEQMSEEVRAAVFGNVGTMIAFRVGAFDAEVLEKEFAPQFTAEDLVNLDFAQIYLKLMIDGVSSRPFSAVTMEPIAPPDVSIRENVLERCRRNYSRPRDTVEKEIDTVYGAKRQVEQQQESTNQSKSTGQKAPAKRPLSASRDSGNRDTGRGEDQQMQRKSEHPPVARPQARPQQPRPLPPYAHSSNSKRSEEKQHQPFKDVLKTATNHEGSLVQEKARPAISPQAAKPQPTPPARPQSQGGNTLLRDALSGVLAQAKTEKEHGKQASARSEVRANTQRAKEASQSSETNQAREDTRPTQTRPPRGEIEQEALRPKEVPEDVLRTILKTDTQ